MDAQLPLPSKAAAHHRPLEKLRATISADDADPSDSKLS